MEKILITGATGNLGKEVVNFLLKKVDKKEVVALARNESKASDLVAKGVEVRIGDYDNYPSLVKAFSGIDKLYFVSGSDVVKRGAQHKNVVKAAKECGVKHVVYTSFQRTNETASSPIAMVARVHLDTEQMLKESGMAYTILKHTLYLDMLPLFMGDKVLQSGTIFLPAGEGKVSYALRKDLAEAAANILHSNGHENKIYEFSASTSISFKEIAAVLTDLSGKTIKYVSPSQEEFQQAMSNAGVPAEIIGTVAAFCGGIKQGEFDHPAATLTEILQREPVTVKDYLTLAYHLA